MNNEIDITKPVRTRDGREVTELHIVAKGVVGNLDGDACWWYMDGRVSKLNDKPSPRDIENVPEPKYAWINVYNNVFAIGAGYVGVGYQSRDDANLAAKNMAGGTARRYTLRLNVDTGETVKEST